mgnify:FL=1
MKYFKALIVFIAIVWLSTAPIAMRARPGSILHRVNALINEPVWAWIHITQDGRADTVEQQFEHRYTDIEHAWDSKEAWQEPWAYKAEDLTTGRVISQINSAMAAQDFKVADTLSAHAFAIARGHKQVMLALVAKPGLGKTVADVSFIDVRLNALTELRQVIAQKFATAYSKTELVKGIDDKLIQLDTYIATADTQVQDANTAIGDTERLAIQNTLTYAKNLQAMAKDKLAADQYVDAYRYANDAEGYAKEVSIVVTAGQEFSVHIPTSFVSVQ